MSLGNGNPKDGDKGSNFNYELKMLQGLDNIATFFENDTEPRTFTADGVIVTGTGTQPRVSCVVTIPPGVLTNNCTIEVKARLRRTGGTANVLNANFYAWFTNFPQQPGNPYVLSGFSIGRAATLAVGNASNFIRTVNFNEVNIGSFQTFNNTTTAAALDYQVLSTSFNSSGITSGMSYYIVFQAGGSGATTMTGICEKAIVTVYY